MAGLATIAGLVLTSNGCTTHKQPGASPATLTAGPTELGECGPNRLARCVPGLADVDEKLFDGVTVFAPRPEFGALPPSAARESAPEECQRLPRFGVKDGPELDVDYRPATDATGKPLADNRFPANGSEYVHVRFTAAGDADVTSLTAAWAHRCPMWGMAPSMDDNRVRGWLVAESAQALSRYESGDVDWQWPFVTNMAVTVLPNGVIVQAWYRTNDPSAASRNSLLSGLIGAAGRPRPRSALPAELADWSQAQISALLPALSMDTGIDARASEPGGQFWSLCRSADHGPTPRYDTLASWDDFDQSKWDQLGKPPRPYVMINRARVGVDYLADLRREIATCTAHLAEKPPLCQDRENHQFLQADSAVTNGEDTVRFTHRWMRVENLQGYDRCTEGVEALRVTQVRGLIVISRSSLGGYLFHGDTPPLPLTTLDELLAETVLKIKAA